MQYDLRPGDYRESKNYTCEIYCYLKWMVNLIPFQLICIITNYENIIST